MWRFFYSLQSLSLVGQQVLFSGFTGTVWWFFSHSDMANIEDLWARFSLAEEEEQGADVPCKKEVAIVRLAAKIFTKRVVNAEAVGRTFKSLWKPIGEMKIRDIEGNILLFEFDDAMDLERMLEFEP